MLTLRGFLEGKRLSELQEIHAFWAGGGTRTPSARQEIADDLHARMRDATRVGGRLKLLAEKPLLVLHLLVRADGYAADLPALVQSADGTRLEGYEVEAAARALGRRGFLDVVRDRKWPRNGARESFAVPRELAETVAVLLMEDRRGPRQVFTLAGHLESSPGARVRRLLKSRGLPEDAASLPPAETAALLLGDRHGPAALEPAGEDLRELLLRAVTECGGVLPRSRYRRDLGEPLRWQRKRWQRYLEEAGLGTVTTLGLADCGIEMEGETTVLFGEVVERVLAGPDAAPPPPDQVASARVDLLTDISHFLRHVASHPIRVTHGRAVHRAAYGRILEGLTFREDALVDRAEVFRVVYRIALDLGLVEAGEDRLLSVTRAGEAWDRVPLLRKVRRAWQWALEERAEDEADFHDRALRRRLAARLAGLPAGRWVRLRTYPFLARNDYLASLEEEGVRAAYRNRFRQDFEPPREDPRDLAEGLVDWILTRLYLLGLVDVGYAAGEPAALRLTDLGARLLAGGGEADDDGPPEAAAPPSKPLVVNPDFEVLLLPEGDVNEVAHTLDRFAQRVRSDEVVRYRLRREGIERAVVQGMSADEVLAFLEERSSTPVPQNVAFSLREWAGRVRFARQREAVLLEVDHEDALDRALELERVRALLLARLGPRVAALRVPITDWKTLEALRALGVYLRS